MKLVKKIKIKDGKLTNLKFFTITIKEQGSKKKVVLKNVVLTKADITGGDYDIVSCLQHPNKPKPDWNIKIEGKATYAYKNGVRNLK